MFKRSLCLLILLMLFPLPSWAMEFVNIPAGCFMMGRDANFEEGHDDELPRHRVCVGAFQMGKYEVTQAEWVDVMGSNPSEFKGRTSPVENVSWHDIQEFIKRINRRDGKRYRLPSEAEWEYAARAGTVTTYACGDDESCLGNIAWYWSNSGERTRPVGQKQPNRWGLHDMQGNVWEWVQDCYHDSYNGAPSDGRARQDGACTFRVLRGGSWGSKPRDLRSAYRDSYTPVYRFSDLGFRLARGQ